MRLVWTTAAVGDLEQISDYLLERSPELAATTIQRIFTSTSELKQFPSRGRPGRKDGTRELVLRQLPYLVVYEVVGPSVIVLRVLHGAVVGLNNFGIRSGSIRLLVRLIS